MKYILALIVLLLGTGTAFAQCPNPINSSPNFPSPGGNVFGATSPQWKSYLGVKADAVNGNLCAPNIKNLLPPIANGDAANKLYVDDVLLHYLGLIIHEPVTLATPSALPTNTYTNGASGVGATLRGSMAGQLNVDGVLVSVGQRILVDHEAFAQNDGVYTVTDPGTVSSFWVLTRVSDFNQAANILTNSFFLVVAGQTQSGLGYVLVTPPPIVVGTTPLSLALFAGPLGGGGIGVVPPPTATTLGGVYTYTAPSGYYINGLSTTGNLTALPIPPPLPPTSTILGGVFSYTAPSGYYINGINTAGSLTTLPLPSPISPTSLTALTPNVLLTPPTITGTGTIGTTAYINTQSGPTYTIGSADAVNHNDAGVEVDMTSTAGATSVSIPAAGSTGFTRGYATTICALSQPTIIFPQSGTINGRSNQVVGAYTCADVRSDGSAYLAPTSAIQDLGGDVSINNMGVAKVLGIQGFPVATTAPSTSQTLIWSGSQYQPGIPPASTSMGAVAQTNAQLMALPYARFPSVTRLGVNVQSDADPLLFVGNSAPCPLNSGAGDVGSQVPSSDGGCFYAAIPAAGIDAREWGVVADNSTDNTVVLQNALNWIVLYGQVLILPRGEIYYATSPSVSTPAHGSWKLQGAGSEITRLRPASGQSCLTVTESSFDQSFNISGMSFLAAGAGNANCLVLLQTGTIPGPAITALSTIFDVTFRGADGWAMSDYWSEAVHTNYVSNINFMSDVFFGNPSYLGNGIVLQGQSGGPNYGVVYNVSNCTFGYLSEGLVYGTYIQGVNIIQNNFTGMHYAVYVQPGAVNTSELNFINNQVAVDVNGVFDGAGSLSDIISGNYMILLGNDTIGVAFATDNAAMITSNFFVSVGGGTSTRGIVASAGGGGSISGNTYEDVNAAYTFDPSVSGIKISDESYLAVPVIATTGSSYNVYIKAPSFFYAGVTAAIGNGGSPNYVRLTIGTTAPLFNGELVTVNGVGGVPNANAVAAISVVDGTHVDLIGPVFAGSYTGGGTLSVVP